MTTQEKVKQLDDRQVLHLFRHIETEMMQKVNVDVETIIKNLPAQIQNLQEIKNVDEIDEEEFASIINNDEALVIARDSLDWMAVNSSTQAYLDDKLGNWQDNEKSTETIISVGEAISAVMIMTTFTISNTNGKGWEFQIGTNDQRQIELVQKLLTSLFMIIKPALD